MDAQERLMETAREAALPFTVAFYKGYTARGFPQKRVRGGGCGCILLLPDGTEVYATCYHVWDALYNRWIASKTKSGMDRFIAAIGHDMLPYSLHGIELVLESKVLDIAFFKVEERRHYSLVRPAAPSLSPTWPVEDPVPGQPMLVVGYPGVGRAEDRQDHIAMRFTVSTVCPGYFTVNPELPRKETSIPSTSLIATDSDLKGMSGSPVFAWDPPRGWRICGIFKSGHTAQGAFRVATLSAFTQHGRLDHGLIPDYYVPPSSKESWKHMKKNIDDAMF